MPDERNVFNALTVRENLALFAGSRDPGAALEAFPELRSLLDHRVSTLSGGERQMVALSHAVLRPGRAILLDEVSRGLSPAAVARIGPTLARLSAPGRVVVMVEQYLHDALTGGRHRLRDAPR